jgi:hypothetical protein
MGALHTLDAMSNRVPEQLAAADAAILATFRSDSVQYPALVASRSGLHIRMLNGGVGGSSPAAYSNAIATRSPID